MPCTLVQLPHGTATPPPPPPGLRASLPGPQGGVLVLPGGRPSHGGLGGRGLAGQVAGRWAGGGAVRVAAGACGGCGASWTRGALQLLPSFSLQLPALPLVPCPSFCLPPAECRAGHHQAEPVAGGPPSLSVLLLLPPPLQAMPAECLLPPLRRGHPCPALLPSLASPLPNPPNPQAEAIGARYAANWSAKHNTPAVAAVGSNGSAPGGGKSGGGKGEAPPNPLLAGTKLDPFAANGSAVREGQMGGSGMESRQANTARLPQHVRRPLGMPTVRRPLHSLHLPFRPCSVFPPFCHPQEALDSSIEELGQTFELKFYAPLAPGAQSRVE